MCILRRLRILLIVFAVIVLCIISNKHSLAQDGNMVSYISSQDVTEVVEQADFLWIATSGGLVKFDKSANKAVAWYNTSNSDIPTNSLRCIAIDNQGFIWIGWYKGLIKFDGNMSWENITIAETGLNPGYGISTISVDLEGNLWVSNLLGLVKYNGSQWELLTPDETGIFSLIKGIIPDKSGNIWFTIGESSIVKYNGQQWIEYSGEEIGLPDDLFTELDVDENGIVWVMSTSCLLRFDGKEWTQIYVDDIGLYTSIDCGPGNMIWCTYQNEYLSGFDGTNWIYYDLDIPIYSKTDVIASDNGFVWIGAANGLYKLENGVIQFINISEVGFEFNYITDIEIDTSDKKWFINNGSLSTYDSVWKNYSVGIILNTLRFDLDGTLWLADNFKIYRYSGGIEEFDFGTWETIDIAIGPLNEKWFASRILFDGLLSKFDNFIWTHYDMSSPFINGAIRFVNTDENGTVWFSDGHGLRTYNGLEWTSYTTSDSDIPFNNIVCSAFNVNNKYFGSASEGLAKFDGVNWTLIDTSNSPLTDNKILCLELDQQGILYIGTADGGLFSTDGERWWNLNMDNSSLPDNRINDIELEGNVKWIATASGLVSYDGMGVLLSKGEPVEMNQIKVYPNPANESIHFNIPGGKYQVSIINLQGTIVQTIITTSNMLDITSLSPGMYCLRILSEDECYSTKFIKQ